MPNIVIDFKPSLTGENTDALVENQGYTYNQAGLTYNQAGVMYGGVYNVNQDIVPTVSLASNIVPSLMGENTQAKLEDQGYTYNQAGLSYNQAGVMYGGIYNRNEDIVPLVSLASQNYPTVAGYSDIYTPGGTPPPPTNSGLLMGILGLTYP